MLNITARSTLRLSTRFRAVSVQPIIAKRTIITLKDHKVWLAWFILGSGYVVNLLVFYSTPLMLRLQVEDEMEKSLRMARQASTFICPPPRHWAAKRTVKIQSSCSLWELVSISSSPTSASNLPFLLVFIMLLRSIAHDGQEDREGGPC